MVEGQVHAAGCASAHNPSPGSKAILWLHGRHQTDLIMFGLEGQGSTLKTRTILPEVGGCTTKERHCSADHGDKQATHQSVEVTEG